VLPGYPISKVFDGFRGITQHVQVVAVLVLAAENGSSSKVDQNSKPGPYYHHCIAVGRPNTLWSM
jgi:hypothetical protein